MATSKQLRIACIFLLGLMLAPFGVASDRSPSEQAFEELFARVTEAVERGALSRETGDQARELWIATRKDLIRVNAAIDTALVEVRSYQDVRQDRGLDDLVCAVAGRERLLAARIRGLESLAGLRAEIPDPVAAPCGAVTRAGQVSQPQPPPPARPQSQPPPQPQPESPRQEKRLSWEPEDLTKSPQHP